MKRIPVLVLSLFSLLFCGLPSSAQQPGPEWQNCLDCHTELTPGIVSDWKISKHSGNDVGCTSCHGSEHKTREDFGKAQLALPEKCAECHPERVEQYSKGKHALAWKSLYAAPTVHFQPMAQIEGLKGCGGCHRLGLKTEEDVRVLVSNKSGFGASSCDTCHTRHAFSTVEAKAPQACQTCHMGIDHPQWEMYSTSKHGVRALLKQVGALPETAAAPTCQYCHMQGGNHEVRTAWGFLAVRLPLPQDPDWAADQTTILKGLGVLDPAGKPTARFDAVKAVDLARLTQEAWQQERDRMLAICNHCHSINFARAELEKADSMIRESDRLMARAINTVADLYTSGALKRGDNYKYDYPDILTFHDAPTSIEQRLYVMFLDNRMRTFQGAFHANPVYTFWYGWSAMQKSLTDITEKAAAMAGPKKESNNGAKPEKPQVKVPAGKPLR